MRVYLPESGAGLYQVWPVLQQHHRRQQHLVSMPSTASRAAEATTRFTVGMVWRCTLFGCSTLRCQPPRPQQAYKVQVGGVLAHPACTPRQRWSMLFKRTGMKRERSLS